MTTDEQDAGKEALRRIREATSEGKTRLSLAGLGLKAIPPEIGEASKVQLLDLSKNKFATLPTEISYLSSLRTLIASESALTTLPAEIGELQNLKELFIHKNRLTELPAEIGLLAELELIWAQENQLESLPPEISFMTALRTLNLHSNRLHTFQSELGLIGSLETLNLNHNSISDITPIGKLKSLRELHLLRNQLSRLPNELFLLEKLETLYLAENRLESISEDIVRLVSLNWLNLAGNPLIKLPRSLQGCQKLSQLYLHGTPVASKIPSTVLGNRWEDVYSKKGPHAHAQDILDYYFRDASTLDEARILVMGRGSAGKTSLCRAMMGRPFDEQQSETEGVEIQIGALKVRCETKEKTEALREIMLHLWDFAGQEITHALHRFFLSSGVIYLLVLENRGDTALDDADDWLRTIHAYSQDRERLGPDVVIALTKQDTKRWELDEEDLRGRWGHKFRSLTFQNTDAKTRLGVDVLKRTLTTIVAEMPEAAVGFPVEYQDAKAHLETMKSRGETMLELAEFRTLCEQWGIGPVEGVPGREKEHRADSLARILHKLGVVLHYADDPRLKENTVLDPQWVTNGVYALLRGMEKDTDEGRARLSFAKARTLLPKESRKGLLFLLRLMERFEMIYPMEVPASDPNDLKEENPEDTDARTIWLMPAVLPVNQPKLRDDSPWRKGDGTELRLRFTYALLPEGLLPRFIVRTWPLNLEMARWRNGTFLREGYAEALVKAVKRDRQVEITVRGPEADRVRLARMISRHMEAINRDAPEQPKGEILVDVGLRLGGQSGAVASMEKVWKDIAVLEIDEAKTEEGISSVDTAEGTKALKAADVLNNISGLNKREWEHGEKLLGVQGIGIGIKLIAPYGSKRSMLMDGRLGPLKVFVSYAHRDKKACDVFLQNLSVMEQDGLIDAWVDNMIPSGEQWKEEITTRLNEADLFIGLVTTPFLASSYITKEERPLAMQRYAEGKLKLAWIIVEQDCGWQKQDFAKMQVILPGGRAVRQWGRMQDAFNAVEKKLREMV